MDRLEVDSEDWDDGRWRKRRQEGIWNKGGTLQNMGRMAESTFASAIMDYGNTSILAIDLRKS